jgi:hypothetical protein
MDYQGLYISAEGGGNQPGNLDGTMIYKNEWTINNLYNKDEVVVYLEHQYIALRSNINKEPDTNPLDWDLLAYWSNNASVSNYRGTFIQGLVLKQYDSVYDRITNGTYINYNPANYTCTTQPNLIEDLHKINNPNSLLPSMFSTPYMFARAGDSTQFDGGITYDGTVPGSSQFLNTFPLLTTFRSNGWKRTGTTFQLDPTSIYAKEGLYKFTATINYWVCNVPASNPNLPSNGVGGLTIEYADNFVIDQCGLNSPITQPSPTGNFNGNQSTLSGTYDVRFGQSYGVRLQNIVFNGYRWGFAIRFGIDFMGITDPVDLRYNYLALSKSPPQTSQLNSVIEILSSPVQEEYVIPFPIINNLLGQSINSTITDTPSNEFISSVDYTPKCIKLDGYPANQTYTLTCSARIGVSYFLNDLQEIRACFQSSPDNIDWVDINERQIIFTETQQDLQNYDVPNIPLYIQHEGYQPDVQFEQQFVRVVLIVIPKPNLPNITRIIIEANGGGDSARSFNPYNCFFQMYPDDTPSTDIVWKQTFENQTEYEGTYNIPYPRNGDNYTRFYNLPVIFGFLPVVCNNYTYPSNICKSVNNQPLIYSIPNYLRCEYGPEWCGVVIRSAGTYIVSYKLTIKLISLFGATYSIVFARNNQSNNYEALYTQRLNTIPIGDYLYIDQTITTNLQLINDGDFIYPLLIWDNLGASLSGIQMLNDCEFSIVKQ